MTALTQIANETPLPESTLIELFLEGVDRFGEAAAFQRMESADLVLLLVFVGSSDGIYLRLPARPSV